MLTLRFDDGTLTIAGADAHAPLLAPWCVWDERVGRHRARARDYAPVVRALHRQVPYRDEARSYAAIELGPPPGDALRPYQRRALTAWLEAGRRGVVVLPTGAGKTHVALHALLAVRRSTLVLVPTIELVHQWAGFLAEALGVPIGRYGGGDKELREVTVATYDSAALFMPHHGNRFGLLVCDECHHLPAEVTSRAADQCLAPFRLGLTATPERLDGQHVLLDELLGPVVHRSDIDELEGRWLARYDVELVEVPMDGDEAESYRAHRERYLAFLRRRGIRFDRPDGWQRFLAEAARDPEGRAVLASFHEQRRLARASRAKLRVLWSLLAEHAGERCIVFTDDNATAYAIGREMVLPVLTHHTRGPERRRLLDGLRAGELPVLVTSRVLNEGVDVPEVRVGIVVSGTGSVREHVQRLGRLLRPQAGKVARLYELVSAGTAEADTSARRREHRAFGGGDPFG